CIESIYEKLKEVSFEIVLVDNASVECDPQLFKKQFPGIKLIVSETNTGFTGGNNLGIEHAVGDYLLLLNSDTELINNAPKICLDHLLANKEVGMVTAQLVYPDGKIQYNCRRFRTIHWELLEVFPFYRFLPKEKREALMLHHYFDHQRFASCDWVWGAFMLFPKAIIQQLPRKKLSDDFFMYCEDVLWCWDFRQLGYDINFLPQAKVMHVHRGSTDKAKLRKVWIISLKNHAKFMKKFYPDFRWYIFAAIYFTKQYGALLLRSIK
ncbi:MAG: glycosyltransferase family 2 protein, partial [Ferruginibacter sp.]